MKFYKNIFLCLIAFVIFSTIFSCVINAGIEDYQTIIIGASRLDSQERESFDKFRFALLENESPEAIREMINENPRIINIRTENDLNSLMLAAAGNENPEIIELLIEKGISVNAKNSYGFGALMYALKYNSNPEIANLLIEAGAEDGVTKLMLTVARNEDLNTIEELLAEGASVHARTENGLNALMYAAAGNNNPEVIELLLESGINVDSRTIDHGMTALMYATAGNKNPEVTKTLLDAGANINAKSKDLGQYYYFGTKPFVGTPLAFSIKSKETQIEVTELLLKAGADVNIENEYGYNALIFSSIMQSKEAVKLLIEETKLDDEGQNAGKAIWAGLSYPPLDRNLNSYVFRTLINAGADVNIRNSAGYTPLMANRRYDKDHTWLVELLTKAGADVNAKEESTYGYTPIMRAVLNKGDLEYIETLIEAGADMNTRAGSVHSDVTLLMKAVQIYEEPEVIKTLIDAGADVNIVIGHQRFVGQERWNHNALILAAEHNKNPEIIEMLLDAGADGSIEDNRGNTAFDYAENNEYLKDTDVYWRLLDAQYQ